MDGKKRIRPGRQMFATHSYEKNPDGPVGKDPDLNEGDTLVYLMKHAVNEHWWLAEDGKGQVDYVPSAYLLIIIDELSRKRIVTQPGKKERGLMGSRLEGRWDRMEKEERRTQQQ